MVVPAHSLVAPRGAMGGQWSLAAYYRSVLMCSVLCQFVLRERTRHDSRQNQKLANPFKAIWNRPRLDVLNHHRVALQTTSTDTMSQERHRRLEKMALRRFQLKSIRPKSLKYQS